MDPNPNTDPNPNKDVNRNTDLNPNMNPNPIIDPNSNTDSNPNSNMDPNPNTDTNSPPIRIRSGLKIWIQQKINIYLSLTFFSNQCFHYMFLISLENCMLQLDRPFKNPRWEKF